jgi:hypothetical protein
MFFGQPGQSFLGTSADITFQHRNRRILKFLPKTDKIANDFQFCRNCGNSAEIAGNSAEICRHFFLTLTGASMQQSILPKLVSNDGILPKAVFKSEI